MDGNHWRRSVAPGHFACCSRYQASLSRHICVLNLVQLSGLCTASLDGICSSRAETEGVFCLVSIDTEAAGFGACSMGSRKFRRCRSQLLSLSLAQLPRTPSSRPSGQRYAGRALGLYREISGSWRDWLGLYSALQTRKPKGLGFKQLEHAAST